LITADPPGWVTIDLSRLALVQLQRCAEHLSGASDDPYRLLDAIRCLHLSLVSALTDALDGPRGTGALDPTSARQKEAWFEDRTLAFTERTMFYRALLEAAQAPGRLHWAQTPFP
jgi:hypothetical protein